MLIDFINGRYRAGMPRREAIAEGVRIWLRTFVLTALTTSSGLLLMALGMHSSSVMCGTTGFAFGTGLATALTLLIVSVTWDLLEGVKLEISA